uniref:Uncharacterized protein n=1 Tax=Phytophthora infestans TaxID=4787 RepID=Q572E0_PHYIN|nr:hypothetical protein PI49.0460 [Phytophthora infestans]
MKGATLCRCVSTLVSLPYARLQASHHQPVYSNKIDRKTGPKRVYLLITCSSAASFPRCTWRFGRSACDGGCVAFSSWGTSLSFLTFDRLSWRRTLAESGGGGFSSQNSTVFMPFSQAIQRRTIRG